MRIAAGTIAAVIVLAVVTSFGVRLSRNSAKIPKPIHQPLNAWQNPWVTPPLTEADYWVNVEPASVTALKTPLATHEPRQPIAHGHLAGRFGSGIRETSGDLLATVASAARRLMRSEIRRSFRAPHRRIARPIQ